MCRVCSVIVLVILGFALVCDGQTTRPVDIFVIPRPTSVVRDAGDFVIKSDTLIVCDELHRASAQVLVDDLAPATAYSLKIDSADREGNVIRLKIDSSMHEAEGYRLEVTPGAVTISAGEPAGIFYGIQTLRQLLPVSVFSSKVVDGVEWSVPGVRIEDSPRFVWRGLMLDCSRHFMPKEFVERFIDLMAIHKLNTFHWHLTDNQGWRIEIKKYPKLTEVGSWRKQTQINHEGDRPIKYDGTPSGGFYTQDDIREVVRYAAERYVTVVPEIEMPGHSTAAVAAYPELGNTGKPVDVEQGWGGNDQTLNPQEKTILFYQDVLAEVIGLFPSKYIHVGGDEVSVNGWRRSPAATQRVKELGLKDVHDIEPYFMRRMDEYLTSKGRRMIGWDEILGDGLPADTAVMIWHGAKLGATAAVAGHDVVMAPGESTYLDHYQSRDHSAEPMAIGGFLPLRKVYDFDPMPAGLSEEQARHILGGQGQIWTEYIPTPGRVEYMAYPRAAALAEDVWSSSGGKNYDEFSGRLAVHLKRLEELKVNFRHPVAGE